MVFIILGVIVLLLGRSFLAKNPQYGKSQSVVYFSAGVLFLLGLSTSVFKMIDAGQVGVQSMFLCLILKRKTIPCLVYTTKEIKVEMTLSGF